MKWFIALTNALLYLKVGGEYKNNTWIGAFLVVKCFTQVVFGSFGINAKEPMGS